MNGFSSHPKLRQVLLRSSISNRTSASSARRSCENLLVYLRCSEPAQGEVGGGCWSSYLIFYHLMRWNAWENCGTQNSSVWQWKNWWWHSRIIYNTHFSIGSESSIKTSSLSLWLIQVNNLWPGHIKAVDVLAVPGAPGVVHDVRISSIPGNLQVSMLPLLK